MSLFYRLCHLLVEQRRFGAPAKWIRVRVVALLYKLAGVAQPLEDELVGIFHIDALVIGNLGCEAAARIDRANDLAVFGDDAVLQTRVEVDLQLMACVSPLALAITSPK